MMAQLREESDFWSLPPLMTLCWRTHLVITKHPEDGHGIAQNRQHHNQIDYILLGKRFRSGVNFARTRGFPGADIGSDHDLLIMTFHLHLKKNQQTKIHRTQVWPRKAERSQCVGNLPSYDRREVCTSHHYEQRRYRPGFNGHLLQHSCDWTASELGKHRQTKKKLRSLQKFLICATDERTQKKTRFEP